MRDDHTALVSECHSQNHPSKVLQNRGSKNSKTPQRSAPTTAGTSKTKTSGRSSASDLDDFMATRQAQFKTLNPKDQGKQDKWARD
jgi:hypothetical protein